MKKIIYLLLLFTAFAKAQIVNIPDANFKAKLLSSATTNSVATGFDSMSMAIDANSDGEIQVSEALAIARLDVRSSFISNISGIESFSNLETLYCDYNQITNLNVTSLTNLVYLSCGNNQLSSFDASSLFLLEHLILNNNLLSTLNVNGLLNLNTLYLQNNTLSSINVSSLTNLETLDCSGNTISSLNVVSLVNLINLKCDANPLTSLNVSTLTNLEKLEFSNCSISSIDVSMLVGLKTLSCSSNGITTLDVSALTNLESLFVYNNQLATLDLTGLVNLKKINCGVNLLTTLNVNFLTGLTDLVYGNSGLNVVNVSNLVNLKSFGFYSGTALPAGLENFQFLEELSIIATNMTDLDLSNFEQLKVFVANGNSIINSINLKHGGQFDDGQIVFVNNPNLTFVCSNDVDIQNANDGILLGNGPVFISSYCTFTPGGDFNTITGSITFDANANGCEVTDLPQPNIKIDINDGVNQGSTFTNNSGNYKFYTEAGSFTVTPNMENLAWFTVFPPSATVPFANDNNNTVTQSFCISPNGIHPDLEIVVAPIVPARPGFDAIYKIVYKNKGNQMLSQAYGVNFFYNENLMDYVTSSVVPTSINSGGLSWSYANLLPFESRSILVTFSINTPTDTTNPVNIGDNLQFTTSVLPMAGDESTSDNTFLYNQTVVGAYDPNNIICMEGNVVSPAEIGNYLHYVINFENTGNFEAENIVVKTEINPAEYDVSSLRMLNTSHNAYVRIKNNIVEFIFESIALESGGHGNILLKVKSKSDLTSGAIVKKRADIYFDYNAPIDTGFENTVFQTLSNSSFVKDNSISIFPNPTNSLINIKSINTIKFIELFDVQGRILITKMVSDYNEVLDISDKSNGIYFLKITSENGIKVEKLIKE